MTEGGIDTPGSAAAASPALGRRIHGRPCAILSLLLGLLLSASPASSQFIQDAVPGGLIEIPLAPLQQARPDAYFGQKRVLVTEFGRRWSALVGLPLGMVPGTYVIQVRLEDSENPEDRAFAVYPGRQRGGAATISLPGPPPEALKMEFEWREALEAALPLTPPVAPAAAPTFGRHLGESAPGAGHADFAAFTIPRNTLVRAPGAGRVAAATGHRTGTWIWIDHGMSLYTRIGPVTDTHLTAADTVTAGQVIGRIRLDEDESSRTFYLSVYLNGAAINPLLIFDMSSTAGPGGGSRPGRAGGAR